MPRKIMRRSDEIPYHTVELKDFKEMSKPAASKLSMGLHSLRFGGATAAANNYLSDRFISKHGSWKSNKGRDGYIKDSISDSLEIIKNLGP